MTQAFASPRQISDRRVAGHTSGALLVKQNAPGVRQEPPLPLVVEGEGSDLAAGLVRRIRDKLPVTTDVTLVPFGSPPRSEYKSKLVDKGH